jgi:hypothetical protein
VAPLDRPARRASTESQFEIVENRSCTEISDSKRKANKRQGRQIQPFELIRGAFVIQMLAQPALDRAQFEAFAPLIIEYLVPPDLAHGKVTRLRM